MRWEGARRDFGGAVPTPPHSCATLRGGVPAGKGLGILQIPPPGRISGRFWGLWGAVWPRLGGQRGRPRPYGSAEMQRRMRLGQTCMAVTMATAARRDAGEAGGLGEPGGEGGTGGTRGERGGAGWGGERSCSAAITPWDGFSQVWGHPTSGFSQVWVLPPSVFFRVWAHSTSGVTSHQDSPHIWLLPALASPHICHHPKPPSPVSCVPPALVSPQEGSPVPQPPDTGLCSLSPGFLGCSTPGRAGGVRGTIKSRRCLFWRGRSVNFEPQPFSLSLPPRPPLQGSEPRGAAAQLPLNITGGCRDPPKSLFAGNRAGTVLGASSSSHPSGDSGGDT